MTPEASQPPARWKFAICILLAVGTLSLYSPVARHPFINFDDDGYVTDNPHVRAGLNISTLAWAITSTEQANWHPLTWLSHALDCQIYGLNAGGHHISSVLLHVLNTILLFLLLARVSGSMARSAVVAALFAIHPLNVESVAWIAERKTVLSMFFLLLALAAYGWYSRRPNWRRYIAVFGLFALGLASKPMVITLPCALLLLDYWPLGRVVGSTKPSAAFPLSQTTWLRLLAEKLPILMLSVASAIITVIAQRSTHSMASWAHLTLQHRIRTALYSYTMYVVKLFWPVHLAIFYPHPATKLTFLPVALSALFLITVTAFAWRERAQRPYLMIGWLWFLGTLVPMIGLIQVGAQGMADRYAYLPSIGVFVMVVWQAADWAEERHLDFRIVAPITIIILAVLGILTLRQIGYWRISYDLWAHALDVTQDNLTANEKLGDLLVLQGKPEALRYYEAAANIGPLDPAKHNEIASSMQDHGDFQGAIREYNIVLRAKPNSTLQAKVYASLGIIYRQLGDYAKARDNSNRALRLDSNAINNTIQQLSELVAAHPAAPAYFQLGLLLDGADQSAEARSAYRQALRLDPNFEPAKKALAALAAQ